MCVFFNVWLCVFVGVCKCLFFNVCVFVCVGFVNMYNMCTCDYSFLLFYCVFVLFNLCIFILFFLY